MNKNKLLSVMLAVILIISMTSCKKTQQIPFEEPEETILHTNVYEIVSLPVIEENICSTYLDKESIYFTVRTENEDKYSFITCDWNGEIQSEVPVVPFPYFLIRQYASLAENTVVFIHMDEALSTDIYIAELDGKILAECHIPKFLPIPPVLMISEDKIAVLGDVDLYIFDFSLQLLQEIRLPISLDVPLLEGDNVYGRGPDGLIYRVDLLSGNTLPLFDAHSNPEFNNQFLDIERNMYFQRTDGLYNISAGDSLSVDAEAVQVMDWSNSFLESSLTDILYIRDKEHLYVRSSNTLDEEEEYVILKRIPDEEVKPKQKVVLAMFREMYVRGEQYYKRLASHFNRSSDKYFVEVQLYDTFAHSKNIEAMNNILFSEMKAGNTPDLLMLTGDCEMMYRNLLEQKYLTDLTVLSDQLTGSVRKAVQVGEMIHRVPLQMAYKTLLTTGNKNALDAKEMISSVTLLEDDQVLFSANVRNDLLDSIQTSFIDFQTETCNFDTPLFRDYLVLLSQLDTYTDSRYGELQYQHYMYHMTVPELPEYLADEKIRYLALPLHNIWGWSVAKFCWGEMEFSICGYPGVTVIPDIQRSLVLMKNAECSEGALEFLQFILSDSVQTSKTIWHYSMPVTTSAYDILLEYDWFCLGIVEDSMTDPMTGMSATGIQMISVHEEKPEILPINMTGKQLLQYTDTDKKLLRSIVDSEECGFVPDPTIDEILQEEIVAYLSGDKSIDETIRVLQSRVGTYLAE